MDHIRSKAENAIREAGKFFLYTKLDKDLVIKEGTSNFATHIDIMTENFLVKELIKILPESNIITEESDNNKYNLDKPTWILDPVDGTINLYHRFQHSAISLALFIEGNPVLAFIYNPVMDEMFIGEAGKGAYLNGIPIKVSECDNLKDCLIGFGTTPYDRSQSEETFKIVKKIYMGCQDIRRSGSAALDIAYVACGRMDGFFEFRLQPWDYAAGMLILKEAGGSITNFKGEEPPILYPDSILATNGIIHKNMLSLMG